MVIPEPIIYDLAPFLLGPDPLVPFDLLPERVPLVYQHDYIYNH